MEKVAADTNGSSRGVRFEESGGKAEGENQAPPGMSDAEFMEVFTDFIGRRDYLQALKACNQRLKAKPDDRYAQELLGTVQQFLDATDELEDEDEELPPSLEEMNDQAVEACGRAFEAMYEWIKEDDRHWSLGEQSVSIFWDVGQLMPEGPRRQRLHDISSDLLARLGEKLQATPKRTGSLVVRSLVPSGVVPLEPLREEEWLIEGVGELWWRHELGMPCEQWLIDGCRETWLKLGGSNKALTGFSKVQLPAVPYASLCDVLTTTLMVERIAVCGMLPGPLPEFQYGISEVLVEICRRPLIEAPLEGFMDCFYIMTHVVYALNGFNSVLPNRRADCPWIYAYLERTLAFWLREVKATRAIEAYEEHEWRGEAVDIISESVDCLRGLGEPETDALAEGVHWLLQHQREDGWFFSPGGQWPGSTDYNHVHPTWVAVAALHLDRDAAAVTPSANCQAWAAHTREAAARANLAQPPPVAAASG